MGCSTAVRTREHVRLFLDLFDCRVLTGRALGAIACCVPCIVYGQNKTRMEHLHRNGGTPHPSGGEMFGGDCMVHGLLTCIGLGWVLQVRSPPLVFLSLSLPQYFNPLYPDPPLRFNLFVQRLMIDSVLRLAPAPKCATDTTFADRASTTAAPRTAALRASLPRRASRSSRRSAYTSAAWPRPCSRCDPRLILDLILDEFSALL